MAIVNSRAAIEPKTGKAAIFVNETIPSLMRKLFSNGEQGFAYDPSDLTTLYQDAAGTIPVTAAGQPVGLMLDKSKGLVLGGNVATGFTSGFILRNLVNAVLLNNPIGAISSNWFPVTPNAFYKIHAPVSNRCRVQVKNASGVITYLTDYSSETSADARLVAALADSVFMRLYFANEAIGSQVTTFEARKLTGNHAYQTVSASRPILQRNATTGAYYLAFDGADDFLQTNDIDFTATDKVSLFAGVRKLSDAATGIVCELSASAQATTPGSFVLFAPAAGGSNHYNFRSFGTTGIAIGTPVVSNFPAPHSAVLRATGGISTNTCELLINGGSKQSTSISQGTGNYGNYPLYIGRRAGTSLPFNGHLYSLIGIGRLTTGSETIALEKAIAKNTGVTL